MTRIDGAGWWRVAVAAAALSGVGGCGLGQPIDATEATVDATVDVPLTTVLPTALPDVTDAPVTDAPEPDTSAPLITSAATTATTVAITQPPAPADGVLVHDLLGFITVQNEQGAGYVRDLFGYPADPDGDSCDTRAEVLMSESQSLPQVAQPGCTVVEGNWFSLYDGVMYTTAGELEIDHVVALKEAWDSGAWSWDPATRVAYGNDLADGRTLRAVSVATNRSKGDKDPSNWIPDQGVCEFLGDWVAVKVRWGLSMDQSEFGRIRNLLNGPCLGTRTPPIAPASVGVQSAPQQFVPIATAPPAAPAPAPADVYYANCDAARAAGAAPLHIGDPGYRPKLDRDGDGIACE